MNRRCPTDQEVADFLAHRTPAAVASDLEAHLDACEPCRELVSILVMDTVPTGARGSHALEGTRVGRFIVAERLGVGGMGAVYAARDPVLDRRVALKLLNDPTEGPWSGRMLREAQALARLAHPNVVAVYDVGEHEGQIFIAMELVEGTTLGRWLAVKPRRWQEILDVFVQAGRGLAAAHEAGFIHRDFKPDNVLLGADGRARVSDFGLARVGDTPGGTPPPPPRSLVEDLTQTGAVVGTPAYMAPEQIDGAATDARADQFAFCVALAEALTGERPFGGKHLVEIRAAIAAGDMRELTSDAPAHVLRAIRRGLAEDRAARHPDMRALLAALTDARGRRIRRGALAAIALGAVAVVGWQVGRGGSAGAAADPCGGAEAALGAVWDTGARAGAQAAFAATGLSYAGDSWRSAERTLEAWAAAWSAARRDACEDSALRREQSDELLDRRMSCLDRELDELRALSEAFRVADRTVVEHAVAAAGALSDPAVCSDRDALMSPDGPPADPARRAQIAAIDRRLAAAHAQWTTGKVADAVATLTTVVTDAATTGHAPTLARAQLRLGTAQASIDATAAQATLREAARTAERARVDAVRADAMVTLVALAEIDIRKPGPALDAALALAADAAAVIGRIGGDRLRGARLATYRAGLLLAAGRVQPALAEVEAAVAILDQDGATDGYARAETLFSLGQALHDLGRLDDAIVQQRRALAIFERELGGAHPNVGAALHNLGLTLQEQGALPEARAAFERAHTIVAAAHGPDAVIVGRALAGLGDTLTYQGEADAALPYLQRALAIVEKAEGRPDADILDSLGRAEGVRGRIEEALRYHDRALALRLEALGPDDRDVALSHLNLGHELLAAGRIAEALPHFRETLRIDELHFGVDGAGLQLDLSLLGQTLVHLGKSREAVAVLERAVAIGDRAGLPLALATSQLFLGRALWESGGDRTRATALVTAARDATTRLGDDPQAQSLVAAIDEWQAVHRLRRR